MRKMMDFGLKTTNQIAVSPESSFFLFFIFVIGHII